MSFPTGGTAGRFTRGIYSLGSGWLAFQIREVGTGYPDFLRTDFVRTDGTVAGTTTVTLRLRDNLGEVFEDTAHGRLLFAAQGLDDVGQALAQRRSRGGDPAHRGPLAGEVLRSAELHGDPSTACSSLPTTPTSWRPLGDEQRAEARHRSGLGRTPRTSRLSVRPAARARGPSGRGAGLGRIVRAPVELVTSVGYEPVDLRKMVVAGGRMLRGQHGVRHKVWSAMEPRRHGAGARRGARRDLGFRQNVMIPSHGPDRRPPVRRLYRAEPW
jgi:hypothetical protein